MRIIKIALKSTLVLIVASFAISSCTVNKDYYKPKDVAQKKRDIRAAWIPTIYRNDYKDKPRNEAKAILSKRIKALSDAGCNMIFFQVRSQGDSWYSSEKEPYSRFLSSSQKCDWDPLAFVTNEAHKHGMDVHAWINPYRAWSNTDVDMPYNHPAKIHPNWVVKYGKQLIFDPGNPDYRIYLLSVIKDIAIRYDIDGIHFDDYFYPYPQGGMKFDDEKSFINYGVSAGYDYEDRDVWRRNNINLFFDQLREMLMECKPWLRTSISPFGIYRNKSTNKNGSETNGIQCYDDLYADVLHWVQNGWIDYVVPQIYWNFGDERADYGKLTAWWSKAIGDKSKFVVGQTIKKTMDENQLYIKWMMSNEFASGNSWWVSEDIWNNYKGITDSLSINYQRSKALLPEVKGLLGKTKAPDGITSVMEDINEDGHMLIWDDVRNPDDPEKPFMYAIYAVPQGYRLKNKGEYLISVSSVPHFLLPSMGKKKKYTFMITTINRFWQESDPISIKVVL